MQPIIVDFEFNGWLNKDPRLVCACTLDPKTGHTEKWWLHRSPVRVLELRRYLADFDTIISYSAIAEARSFMALGLDPLCFKWIDLFLEYRLVSNHNDILNWGKQLVDGKVKFFKKPPPKFEREDGKDYGPGFKPSHSLAEATFKLTGQIRDTAHKTKMRDLIISAPDKFSAEEKVAILDYCLEDVVFLKEIGAKIQKEFMRLTHGDSNNNQYLEEAFVRGRYAAHTAIMESNGYPVDIKKTKNFSDQVPSILMDCQRQINSYFPEVKPFKWNRLQGRFTWDQKATRRWIECTQDVGRWMRTDTGALSLSLEAWEKFFAFKHDYPTDNFGAQMVRFLKLKQSLYGFSATGTTRKNFWDSVGPDERVRPYMNIYGAQSSRSQPGATGFMFLKPAWMRALVQPKPGRFMAGIDYGSQEFFISALESRDQNMINAYLSGDPYLAFGKLAGVIPPDGTKATHKFERDLCKSTVLGISFLMSKYGLAPKLTNDTGRHWDEDEAQEQIDLFYETFSDLKEYQEWLIDIYQTDGYMKLPCGWYMFGDNPNHRSVANMRVQGFGASVMRKAVDLAVEQGLQISFTLHDAIYIEGDMNNLHHIAILRDCMREAFMHYFEGDMKKIAAKIKLDPFAWGPNMLSEGHVKIPSRGKREAYTVPVNDLYLDDRAERDYKLFSRYFENESEEIFG